MFRVLSRDPPAPGTIVRQAFRAGISHHLHLSESLPDSVRFTLLLLLVVESANGLGPLK